MSPATFLSLSLVWRVLPGGLVPGVCVSVGPVAVVLAPRPAVPVLLWCVRSAPCTLPRGETVGRSLRSLLHVGLPQEMTVQVRDLLPLGDGQALPRPPRDRAVVPWQVSGPGRIQEPPLPGHPPALPSAQAVLE